MSTRSVGAHAALWMLFKRAFDITRTAVVAEVTAATGLSEPEMLVLIALEENGGSRRQSQLAGVLEWDRTRLSHLLTRMEGKALVHRHRDERTVEVRLGDAGRTALTTALPALEEAARAHLTDLLLAGEDSILEQILRRLASSAEADRDH